MPIYEFVCLDGHYCEKLLSVHRMQRAELKQDMFCNYIYTREDGLSLQGEQCGLILNRLWSLPANTKTPEDSKSNFTYYENKRGEIEFTGTPNQWHPKGFIRKEARNLYERLAIEKRIRKQDNERLEKQREQRDIQRHYSTAERHSELRQRLREGQMLITNSETGNKESVILDERSKSIIKKGMEYTDKKKIKKIDSEFHFSANHDDKSNVRGE